MAFVVDEKVEGLCGVVREREFGKFFCDYNAAAEPYMSSITAWRGIKAAMRFVREYRGPVLAVSRHAEGCRNLTRLGFSHGLKEYWIWVN